MCRFTEEKIKQHDCCLGLYQNEGLHGTSKYFKGSSFRKRKLVYFFIPRWNRNLLYFEISFSPDCIVCSAILLKVFFLLYFHAFLLQFLRGSNSKL